MRSRREITVSSTARAFSTPPPKTVEEQKAETRVNTSSSDSGASSLPSLEMSLRDREILVSAIVNPPSPNSYLRAAAKKYFRRIHS
jgi:hypothetical protein